MPMRVLCFIIIGSAISIVAVRWLNDRRTEASPFPLGLASPQIRITGPGNTLASLAQQVDDPRLLSYDPVTRRAVANASLVIDGDLQLGRRDASESGETLALATELCGDLRIHVRPGGKLRMYNESRITTVSQTLSPSACSKGYALLVDGSLEMTDSEFGYISGSRSRLRGQVEASIRRSVFSYSDGSALSLVEVDGGRIVVDDCDLLSKGEYGVVVRGSGGQPVQIRNSLLEGTVGAVLVTGESAQVQLVDCVLGSKRGIVFNGFSGEVEVAWTRYVRVVDSQTNAPKPGVTVRVQSQGDGVRVEAQTDEQGIAELILPEWFARPGSARPQLGRNTVAPLRICAFTQGHEDAVPTQVIHVSGKDSTPIELTLAF